MRVQRVVMPATGETSWTVVNDDFGPVEPIERYLAHLVCQPSRNSLFAEFSRHAIP